MTIETELSALTTQTNALDSTIQTELVDVNSDINDLRYRVAALEIGGVSGGGNGGGTGGGTTTTTGVLVVSSLPTTGDYTGQVVFLTTDEKLYVWDGTSWRDAKSTFTGDAPDAILVVSTLPTTGTEGDVVFNSTDGKLYRRVNGVWTEVAIQVNTSAIVADASVNVAKFALGLRPVEIVDTLPTTGNVAGRLVFLTTDNKLYRYNGTAFVASIPTSDLTGTILTNQIEANAITTGKIQAGAITASQIAADAVNASKIAAGSITADKIVANAVTADKIATNAITAAKIEANAITAGKIAAGAIGTSQLAAGSVTSTILASGSVTAGKIAAGTITASHIATAAITADKLTSGNASVTAGGTFSLGGGQALNGYSAVVAGSTTLTNGFGAAGYLNNSTSAGWSGSLGATTASNGYGGGFYNATDTNYNSFRTNAGLAQGTAAGQFRYNRSIGTANNISLMPETSANIATSQDAGYFAYTGPTSSSILYEAFLGNSVTGSGMVGRRYTTGGAVQTEAYIATNTYSFYGSYGKAYAAAGWAPFTGVHDGLVDSGDQFEPGDIVVDAAVLAHLDISNSIVKFKRSTSANQKGIVGVFVQSYDEPPIDWLPAAQLEAPEAHPWQTQVPTPSAPVENPAAYDVPAGTKVAHVNALGEGLINVCGENGNIEVGDLIVTSSIPGKGMKQADDLIRSYTVAKARESVTFSSPTDVKQIACIYVAG